MTLIDQIKIVSLDGTDLEGINERLKTLLLCVKNTIPGSRRFGLSREFLDEPVNMAANTLAAELQEGVDAYITEVAIESVKTDFDLNGRLAVTINVEGSDNG